MDIIREIMDLRATWGNHEKQSISGFCPKNKWLTWFNVSAIGKTTAAIDLSDGYRTATGSISFSISPMRFNNTSPFPLPLASFFTINVVTLQQAMNSSFMLHG